MKQYMMQLVLEFNEKEAQELMNFRAKWSGKMKKPIMFAQIKK